LALDGGMRLCGWLSHRRVSRSPALKQLVTTIIFATAAAALMLVEYPIDVNEQLVSGLPATVVGKYRLEGDLSRGTIMITVPLHWSTKPEVGRFG
jgi:hypothetical protein